MIKNPISDHLPTGCMKIGTSFNVDEVVKPSSLAPDDKPIVFVIGAMAHGSVSGLLLSRKNEIKGLLIKSIILIAVIQFTFVKLAIEQCGVSFSNYHQTSVIFDCFV